MVKVALSMADTSVMATDSSSVRVRPATANPAPGQRPAAERYAVSVQVGILTDDGHMCGNVRDISVSGARIEQSGFVPEPGSQVQLGFAFFAHALPVPMLARVVRHTDEGGFAVEFEKVDFRTRILLRSLLPNVASDGEATEPDESGHLELNLHPVLQAACIKAAESQGARLEDWILAQLEEAALKDGRD